MCTVLKFLAGWCGSQSVEQVSVVAPVETLPVESCEMVARPGNENQVSPFVTFPFINEPEGHVRVIVQADNHNQFSRMFQDASNIIPLDERHALLAHWLQEPHGPLIFIQDADYIEVSLNDQTYKAVGANMDGNGFSFRFAGRAMMQMPLRLVRTLIVHEFAHAIQTLKLIARTLPEAEQEAFDQLGECPTPQAVTKWQETFTDLRTLSWHHELDGAELRNWLREYLAASNVR